MQQCYDSTYHCAFTSRHLIALVLSLRCEPSLPLGCRQKRRVVGEAAGSGASTEGSQGSRPKRAVQRFDYNVLNGTSGNLNAMLHAAGQAHPMPPVMDTLDSMSLSPL